MLGRSMTASGRIGRPSTSFPRSSGKGTPVRRSIKPRSAIPTPTPWFQVLRRCGKPQPLRWIPPTPGPGARGLVLVGQTHGGRSGRLHPRGSGLSQDEGATAGVVERTQRDGVAGEPSSREGMNPPISIAVCPNWVTDGRTPIRPLALTWSRVGLCCNRNHKII